MTIMNGAARAVHVGCLIERRGRKSDTGRLDGVCRCVEPPFAAIASGRRTHGAKGGPRPYDDGDPTALQDDRSLAGARVQKEPGGPKAGGGKTRAQYEAGAWGTARRRRASKLSFRRVASRGDLHHMDRSGPPDPDIYGRTGGRSPIRVLERALRVRGRVLYVRACRFAAHIDGWLRAAVPSA
ncbi:hypothetical protein BD310DRAFT_689341 [Dichomitus squalens]|uniref:Uncharacterized protein n=1 Tax=Dichomitus squalens TaxID=114155 RepID=A0A4Q9PMA6_9APHY|nr:hypothetical protein BD310DRAFT_689341 [Dichomitus squalens]